MPIKACGDQPTQTFRDMRFQSQSRPDRRLKIGKRKQTYDLEKELMESSNWTRISEIVEEITKLYKSERDARAHKTNLLLGQKFFELRKLVTGTDEEFNPKSAEGRRWGRFAKTYLKG